MNAKVQHKLSDANHKVIQAGPWYVCIYKKYRACYLTSGDYWFPITRHEAAQIILRKSGW